MLLLRVRYTSMRLAHPMCAPLQLVREQSYVTLNTKHYPYSVLWGLTVHSPIRQFFIWLVEWTWFDRASLALIVLNVFAMTLSRPTATEATIVEEIFAWSDPFFSIIFTVEMICKLLASGLVLNPFTYLRDGWNWIDAAVVASAWITWQTPGIVTMFNATEAAGASSGTGNALKALRTVRVLRPLRTVTRVRGMRVVVQALLQSVPEMASVLAILLFIFVFFGIFGVQLFAGALRWRCVPEDVLVEPCARNRSIAAGYCFPSAFSDACLGRLKAGDDDAPCLPLWASSDMLGDSDAITCDGGSPDATTNCVNGGVCTYFSSNPNNNITSFDTFPASFVTIFYSMTLEGWVDTMYMLLKAVPDVSFIVVLFFLALVLFGAIFVFNLLLAVVFDNFSSINEQSINEAAAEAEAQAKAGDPVDDSLTSPTRVLTRALTRSLSKDTEGSATDANDARSLLTKRLESHQFELIIVAAILCNTIMMSLDWSPPPFGFEVETMQSLQDVTSAIFGFIFVFEMLVKMFAYGVLGYFAIAMNRFDFVIVVSSLAELIILLISLSSTDSSPSTVVLLTALRALKALRTLRLLRLMNLIAGMRKVVDTLAQSAAHILYLFMILLIFCIIFSLLGMETLAQSMAAQGSTSRFEYTRIYRSMINVFVVLSGENWNDLLKEGYAYVGPFSAVFYITLLIVCNWILLNLFVAILLSNINQLSKQEARQKLDSARALIRRFANLNASKRMVVKKWDTSSKAALGGIITQHSSDTAEAPPNGSAAPKAQARGSSTSSLTYCLSSREPNVESDTPRARVVACIDEHATAFSGSIQVLIFLSSLILVLELPNSLPQEWSVQALPFIEGSEIFFTIVFTLEALVKIVGYGARGYFCNSWNLLDAGVVLISWPTLIFPTLQQYSFLRALRSLRMLKIAAMNEGMRVVIMSLYHSGNAIFNVFLVMAVFLVIFGILGMQLNAGLWNFCSHDILRGGGDPYDSVERTFEIATRVECLATNGTWMAPHYGNFDNIFSSMLLLFEMSTLEGWPDVMLYMADAAWDQARPVDTAPVPEPTNHIYVFVILFWTAWIFVAAFVIMNLFVGVVVEEFQSNQDRSAGTAFLSERQQKWVLVMSVITQRRSQKTLKPPRGSTGVRRRVFFLIVSSAFEVFIMSMILLSVVTMMAAVYEPDMTPFHSAVLSTLNILFCLIFLVEMCLKMFGLGIRKYFSDRWNVFDFLLVSASMFDLINEQATSNSEGLDINPVFLRSFRLIRLGRLLRLVRGFKATIRLIDTLLTSLPALANVLGLLLLLLVIYAIAGMSLFHGVRPKSTQFLDWEDGGIVGFDNFAYAVLLLFRCVTGESWNGIMHDYMISDPAFCDEQGRTCASPVLAVIYFVSFTIFGTVMLLNLLIGVVLQNFSNTLASGSVKCITTEQLDLFCKAWRKLDPRATHQIREVKLPVLMHVLKVHSWVYCDSGEEAPVAMYETVLLAKQLHIPVRDGFVSFQEVLQAIAKAVHHGFQEKKVAELAELEVDRFRLMQTNAATDDNAEDVARARALMRRKLLQMQSRSLIRTGIVHSAQRFQGRNDRKLQDVAALVLQQRWRGVKMLRAARQLADDGKLLQYVRIGRNSSGEEVHQRGAFSLRTYYVAVAFITTTKLTIIYRRDDIRRARFARTKQALQKMQSANDDDEVEQISTDDALRDMANVVRGAKMEQAPMSTSYAVIIIQTAWKAQKAHRSFSFARGAVIAWQARARGVLVRKEAARTKHAALVIQARVSQYRMKKQGNSADNAPHTHTNRPAKSDADFYAMDLSAEEPVLEQSIHVDTRARQVAAHVTSPSTIVDAESAPTSAPEELPFEAAAYGFQSLGKAALAATRFTRSLGRS